MTDISKPNSESTDEPTFPRQGRLLGVDFGTKRIGLAICDPDQSISTPIDNYTRRNTDLDGKHFQQTIKDWNAIGVVIGLPVHLSGDESEKSRQTREFGNWLKQLLQLPVTYWDERFSSQTAEAHLLAANLTKKQRKARLDKLAAQIILQSFLDTNNRSQTPTQFL